MLCVRPRARLACLSVAWEIDMVCGGRWPTTNNVFRRIKMHLKYMDIVTFKCARQSTKQQKPHVSNLRLPCESWIWTASSDDHGDSINIILIIKNCIISFLVRLLFAAVIRRQDRSQLFIIIRYVYRTVAHRTKNPFQLVFCVCVMRCNDCTGPRQSTRAS